MKITIKNAGGDIVKTLDADINKTLLKQLEAEGIEIPSACFTGICGACMCEIEEGEDGINKEAITASGFPLADEEVMTCIAKVKPDYKGEIVLKSMY
ncbi:MAG: (2Fe-2S)-binding protein [Candidatus Gracilibacteria bacterium]|nr:(2Fe-2S)-binding protein [Candidatus Gracilibacteria bacterium]